MGGLHSPSANSVVSFFFLLKLSLTMYGQRLSKIESTWYHKLAATSPPLFCLLDFCASPILLLLFGAIRQCLNEIWVHLNEPRYWVRFLTAPFLSSLQHKQAASSRPSHQWLKSSLHNSTMKLLLPSIVVLSAFSSVQAESSVYLSPSSSSSSAQAISNSQFASVLAHHLQVADHKLGQFIGKESKIWNWLPTNKQKATDNVNSLFQSKQDEMNLVLHVKGANKIHG